MSLFQRHKKVGFHALVGLLSKDSSVRVKVVVCVHAGFGDDVEGEG